MKKNLSDLLREEVNKETSNPEGETPTPKTSRRRQSPTTEPDLGSIKALESQVKTLESELEQQQKLVKTLQEQVQDKQAQDTEIKQLSNQLKQSQTDLEKQLQEKQALSNQLEDQKRLIEKLYSELMDKHEEELSAPQPEPEPEPSQAIVKQSRASYYVERLIAPNASSRSLPDDVIGWFD
ncbi:hypothetical protein [Chroococcus sp. FPU101]|uniref:hypothetical protein n=1 Tax=Chroococcus sp. FPU101 TaxID=1974212 RepID=UPI001A8EB2D4|nr:hypothetical protein [Chroococcus sp. FPU101]GFE70803.1 hypothetical protein CFPU101_34130 [Chroococcus sp. FPU101]